MAAACLGLSWPCRVDQTEGTLSLPFSAWGCAPIVTMLGMVTPGTRTPSWFSGEKALAVRCYILSTTFLLLQLALRR